MKRTGVLILVSVLFTCRLLAQSQAGAQAGAETSAQAEKSPGQASGSAAASSSVAAENKQVNGSLAEGSAIHAALNQPLDSKKAKAGDPVSARTTEATKADGQTVIPKGAKLIGHVSQASSRAKGDSESSLGVVFDKAILKSGQEVPLNVAIQALATPQASAATAGGEDVATMGSAGASAAGSGRATGNRALGGVTSTAGGAAGTVTNTAARTSGTAGGALNSTVHSATNVSGAERGTTGGLNAAGQLTSNSRGVFGLQGVGLNSATSGATQGSVITSAGKNVHLDGGTQMLLVTQAAAASPTAKL